MLHIKHSVNTKYNYQSKPSDTSRKHYSASLHTVIIITTKCIKHELRKQRKSVYRLSGHISDYNTSSHKTGQKKHKVYSYPEGPDLLQAQEPQQTYQ